MHSQLVNQHHQFVNKVKFIWYTSSFSKNTNQSYKSYSHMTGLSLVKKPNEIKHKQELPQKHLFQSTAESRKRLGNKTTRGCSIILLHTSVSLDGQVKIPSWKNISAKLATTVLYITSDGSRVQSSVPRFIKRLTVAVLI